VRQKLLPIQYQCDDVVQSMGDGVMLFKLIELLSDTKYPGKYNNKPKMRIHKIDNLNRSLKFCWDSGVVLKLKPSAEAILDKDVRSILGLISNHLFYFFLLFGFFYLFLFLFFFCYVFFFFMVK